jgi:pimeloyl-ACP methyl ester carboxylesterase
MRRNRVGKKAEIPIVDGLETRALLAVSVVTGFGATLAPEVQLVHHAETQPAQPEHHALSVDHGGRLDTLKFKVVDTKLRQFPLLERLAKFVPDPNNPHGGLWVPVQAQSIGESRSGTSTGNVYVVAHGWMPGYLDWVDKTLQNGKLPLSWETWQNPKLKLTPSTPWLYQGSKADAFGTGFTINDTGLAEEILKVDPNATVLAYSWIDQSATTTTFSLPDDAYHSEAFTTMNGIRMAEAIAQALVPGYAQDGPGKVHLIGHSHGARVATVAALALQQAAAVNPAFNVVGQLTLLDSPEDNGAEFSKVNPLNPINIDAANFDWFYLAQLEIAQPGAPSVTVPAGTNPVTPLFVDSYTSYFGSNFNGFIVNDPYQGIDGSLGNIVDVALNPNPLFHDFDRNRVSLEHQYAANWYAGSESTAGTTAPVGLLWSPLIPNSTPPPVLHDQSNTGQFVQEWSPVDASHQFILTQQGAAPTQTPQFSAVTLAERSKPQGDVTVTGPSNAVTGVTLDDKSKTGTTAVLKADLDKNGDKAQGFSFSYSFTGGCTDGAQLQIWLNGRLYFAMTGSVAKSNALPASGTLSATFGLGGEYSDLNPQHIQIRLVNGANTPGSSPTTVHVNNFSEFTL